MSEHNHNYDHCCRDHTPDNHGCGSCGHHHFNKHKKEMLFKIIMGAILFVTGYCIQEFTALPDFAYLLCFAVAYILVGFSVVCNAVEGVIHGRIFDENFLMTIASVGAFAIKEYTEGVAVMLLFVTGEYIQGIAVSKSRGAVDKIINEKQDAYTLPRHYDNKKSDTEEYITKFARVYTPAICLIAVAIVVIPPLFMHEEWHRWFHRGLAAIVVGCPCAIVISIPLCYSAGIGSCSRSNIFVKNTGTMDDIRYCKEVMRFGENCSIDDIKVQQNIGNRVIYIGDGNGDEELFEQADVSVAIGCVSSAQAIELADIVVEDIPKCDVGINKVKQVSAKVHRLAVENIIFSLLVKMVILVLDVLLSKDIPMWFALFGDVGVCLLAVANSARALKTSK